MSEVGGTIGDRVMNIEVEGEDVYEALDIVAVTGYPTSFFTLTVKHYISDGSFTIRVHASVGNPAIAAIQVTVDGQTNAPVPPPAPTPLLPSSYFINVGSDEPFVEESGQIWVRDSLSTGSAVNQCATHPFNGIDNGGLYCQYREWPELESSGVLEFPVTPGTYTLRLYFSETSAAAGERLVDVLIEGQLVSSSMDVASRIGGSYGLYTLTVTGFVADGSISIELQATKGSAVLAALQITNPNAAPQTSAPTQQPTSKPTQAPTPSPSLRPTLKPTSAPTPSPSLRPTKAPFTLVPTAPPTVTEVFPILTVPPTPSPTQQPTQAPIDATPAPTSSLSLPPDTSAGFVLRVNSGSSESTVDSDGNIWEADAYFQGGSTFSACPIDIMDTSHDFLYCSERWGNPSYVVPVPKSGHYKVVLHFAEIFCK